VSNFCSGHQTEATLFDSNLEHIWKRVRNFDFDYMVSGHVARVFGKVAIGEQLKIDFKDGSYMIVRIVELSDIEHCIVWEMLETSPPINCSAILNRIQLVRVTDCNATFMCWDTEFSNDVDMRMVEENRNKKLEYF